jgi:hypothetical protein
MQNKLNISLHCAQIILTITPACFLHHTIAYSMDNHLIQFQQNYEKTSPIASSIYLTEECINHYIEVLDAPQKLNDNIKKYYDFFNTIFPSDLSRLILAYHTPAEGNLYEHIALSNHDKRSISQILNCNNFFITLLNDLRYDDSSIYLWNIRENQFEFAALCEVNKITSLALCGKYLVAGLGSTMKIWNITTQSCLKSKDYTWPITALTKICSRGIIASGDSNGIMRICNLSTGKTLQAMRLPEGVATLITTKNKDLLVGCRNGLIAFFKKNISQNNNVTYLSIGSSPYKHAQSVTTMAQRNEYMISGSADETIVLLDTSLERKSRVLVKGIIGKVNSLVIDHDNNIIAVGNA